MDSLDGRCERACVVGLGVVGDNAIYLARVDDRADTLEHFVEERRLHRVDQRGFVGKDKVSVVGRAVGGEVTVEVPYRPVDRADPVDAVGYFYSLNVSDMQESPLRV